MAMPANRRSRIDSVVDVMLMLDDEELWELVCRMLPNGDQETLEDVYDVLIALKHEDEPSFSFEEVVGRTPKEVCGG